MQAIQYDQTVTLSFRDVNYFVHGFVDEEGDLVVEVEQKANGARWCGRFSPAAVEELTRKTGNFKKFPIFVKMLATAFSRSSESVFVEMFTYGDLEALRKKRSGGTLDPQKIASKSKSNKRYLILTYIVEFDKVHYPLRLKFDENPDPKRLINTIARLRDEIATAKSDGQPSFGKLKADVFRLQEENKRLQNILDHQTSRDGKDESKLITSLEEEVMQLREELRKRDSLVKTLIKTKDQGDIEKIDEIKRQKRVQAEHFEEERDQYQRKLLRLQGGLKSTKKELEYLRESEQRYRVEVRKLKAELRALGRKTNRTRRSTPTRPVRTKSRAGTPSRKSRPGASRTRRRSTTAGRGSRSKSRTLSADGTGTKSRKARNRGFSFSKSNRFNSGSRASSRSRAGSRTGSRAGSRRSSRNSSRASSANNSRSGSPRIISSRSKSNLISSGRKTREKQTFGRMGNARKTSATAKSKRPPSPYKAMARIGESKKLGKDDTRIAVRMPKVIMPAKNDSTENFDPQREISAIDDRIKALQTFLKSAKTTGSTT
ncbi:hypothetical protein AAMO2058_001213200 [Amorphochlora amoebiformis]